MPSCWPIGVIQILSFSRSSLSHAPKLQRWMEAMKQDPAVQATMTDTQTFKNFLQLYLKNSPEACDYGLWGVTGHVPAEVSVLLFSVCSEDLV